MPLNDDSDPEGWDDLRGPLKYIAATLIGGYQFGSVSVLGSKVFYARANLRRGSYAIWIKKLEPGLTGPVLRRLNLNNSVTSDFSVPISQSGFYMIHTDGWPVTGA